MILYVTHCIGRVGFFIPDLCIDLFNTVSPRYWCEHWVILHKYYISTGANTPAPSDITAILHLTHTLLFIHVCWTSKYHLLNVIWIRHFVNYCPMNCLFTKSYARSILQLMVFKIYVYVYKTSIIGTWDCERYTHPLHSNVYIEGITWVC